MHPIARLPRYRPSRLPSRSRYSAACSRRRRSLRPRCPPPGAGAPKRAAARIVPDGARALAHVKYLASDELAGRKSGTPGYRKAAEYVAAEMHKAGLEAGRRRTAPGSRRSRSRTGRTSSSPSASRSSRPRGAIYFAGRGRDFTPVSGTGSGDVKGGLVFAGYGVVCRKGRLGRLRRARRQGQDRPAPARPPRLRSATRPRAAWTFEKKVKAAAEKGAVGLIEMDLSTPGEPRRRRPAPALRGPPPRPGARGLRRHAGRPRFPQRRLLSRRQELAGPRQQDAPPQEALHARPRRRGRDGGPFRLRRADGPERRRHPARHAIPSSRTRPSSSAATSTTSASASTAGSTPGRTTTPARPRSSSRRPGPSPRPGSSRPGPSSSAPGPARSWGSRARATTPSTR